MVAKKAARGLTLQLPSKPSGAPKAGKAGGASAPAGKKRRRGAGASGPEEGKKRDFGANPKRQRKAGGKDGGKGGGDRAKGGSQGKGPGAAEGQLESKVRKRRAKGGSQGKGPDAAEGQLESKVRSRSALRSALKKQHKREEKKIKELPKKQRSRIKLREKQKKKKLEAKQEGLPPVQQPQKPQQPQKRKKLKASEVVDATCKRGHTLHKRSDNPFGYLNPAACDKCGMADIVKKTSFFFHCAFCKFDICQNCILEWRQAKIRPPKFIREMRKEEAGLGDGSFAARMKKKADKRLGLEMDNREFNLHRRDVWLPSDSTAINRAPVEVTVISDWVEGVPL